MVLSEEDRKLIGQCFDLMREAVTEELSDAESTVTMQHQLGAYVELALSFVAGQKSQYTVSSEAAWELLSRIENGVE